MSRPDVKAIRARADAATAGPWDDVSSCNRCDEVHLRADPTNRNPCDGYHATDADRAFIAAARTDMPALCDRVEALERALRAEFPCERGAPDESRCGECRTCVRLRVALEGE